MSALNTLTLVRRAAIYPAPLAPFEPLSLAELQGLALLDRVDTKYLLGLRQLREALERVTSDYRVLEIGGLRISRYRTVYYDTPDFALYYQHHNGMGSRYKVRAREYVDSQLAFVEIKHKTSQGRTHKSRLQVARLSGDFEGPARDFVSRHNPYEAAALEPKLWNEYLRVTFASKRHAERLTIDTELSFGTGETRIDLPGLAIAEIKQARFAPHTEFISQMRRLGLHPSGFSKYCMGATLLYPQLKSNNFRASLRHLEAILIGEQSHEPLH